MLNTLRRLAAWLRRDTLDDQLAEEIREHLERRVQSLVADGMSGDDAVREARRRFGNVLAIREESRAMWGLPSADAFLQDLRFGARLLRRSPTFTAVSVLSLGIGVGGAVAVFSLGQPTHRAPTGGRSPGG